MNPSDRRRLIGISVTSFILGLLFIRPLAQLIHFALDKERESYLLLVPVISGYLIWIKRSELVLRFKTSLLPAILPLGLGLLSIFMVAKTATWAHPIDKVALQTFALLNLFWAASFLFLGTGFLKQILFPISFLIFCVPVPSALVDAMEIFLQHTSAEAAYWMLSLTGVPMVRSGLQFNLPGIPIRVAQECSGFNSTFSLFMVSLVAAHLFLKTNSRRAALALFVIPLAILRNGFRITTIALLCVYIDPSMIDSFIHHHGGPIFFALSLIPFFGALWLLRKSESPKQGKQLTSKT